VARYDRGIPKRVTSDGRVTELLDAVYDDPLDDDRRRVYADALLEAGNPRGELIALQLRGDASSARRERALLAKFAKSWLGPIASIVSPKNREFRRGFVARVREIPCASPSRLVRDRDRARLRAAREWRTVEELEVGNQDIHAADFLAIPKPALRGVWNVGLHQIGWLARKDLVLPWTTLGLHGLLMNDFTVDWRRNVRALDALLPDLRRLEVPLVHPITNLLEALAGSATAKRLEVLRLRAPAARDREALIARARSLGVPQIELAKIKTAAAASAALFANRAIEIIKA
jgi:uncharacterized protein (TIGR02996 family)